MVSLKFIELTWRLLLVTIPMGKEDLDNSSSLHPSSPVKLVYIVFYVVSLHIHTRDYDHESRGRI